jgi:hypothetical protein
MNNLTLIGSLTSWGIADGVLRDLYYVRRQYHNSYWR